MIFTITCPKCQSDRLKSKYIDEDGSETFVCLSCMSRFTVSYIMDEEDVE